MKNFTPSASSNTDLEWEKWGAEDPYYGVLTHNKFRRKNLTRESKQEFFDSGRKDVNHVLKVCRQQIDSEFSPKKILDFGCGVGRLLIPFAELAEQVVGLDVSGSMLEEARKNCNEADLNNIMLVKSDDSLSRLTGRFDLIHSFIVFQHIPTERGRHIFSSLLNHLEDRGICCVHFTYAKASYSKNCEPTQTRNIIWRIMNSGKRLVRGINWGCRKKESDPTMQMNPYNANEILFLIQKLGAHSIYTEFTNHGGELGMFIFFQKK